MKSRYLALLTASIARTSFSMLHFAMVERTYTLNVYNFMNNITLDVECFPIFPKICRHLDLGTGHYLCLRLGPKGNQSSSVDPRAVPGDFHNHFSPEFPIFDNLFQLSKLHPNCFLHTIHPSGTGSTPSPSTFCLS